MESTDHDNALLTWRVTSSGHDPIWPRSHLIAGLGPPSPPSCPASITGLFTESRYVQSQIHRQTLTPRKYLCPQFFLVILIFLVPLSSSRWWMYLQIFLPSFVLSQLYNWPARASVSRVSAPRGGWNWSHYGDGITATSATRPRGLQSSKVNIDIVLSLPSDPLSSYKILITDTE